MVDIPDDLRCLKDFPAYDASFQDGPNFRQNLSQWALRTDKLASMLTSLADYFQQFHDSGIEHYNAATNMLSSMQDIGKLCSSSHGNTVSLPVQKFSESLTNLWCYYDAFLGQTKMLNIGPIKDLANSFVNLKKLYDELLYYREEYRSSAEKLCACRHMTRLPDKSTFTSMTESCYSAEKTYRLILSKYLTLLRQAHTTDIMIFVRRIVEHILSLFAYHNNSAVVLREIEPEVNEFFTESKKWKMFYEEELALWSKLHHSVQRHIMAEFQLNVGLIPRASIDGSGSGTPHHSGSKVPKLKKFQSHISKKDLKAVVISPPVDADVTFTDRRRYSDVKTSPQNGHPALSTNKQLQNIKQHLPISRTRSSPIVDPDDILYRKGKSIGHRKLVRSISDPDLVASSSCEILDEGGYEIIDMPTSSLIKGSRSESLGGKPILRGSPQHNKPVVRYSKDTVESAANAIEEMLSRSQSHSAGSNSPSFRPFAVVRAKLQKKKRSGKVLNSSENLLMETSTELSGNYAPEEERSSSGTPPEGQSPTMTRKSSKSSGTGLFRKKNKKPKEPLHKLKSSISQPEKLGQDYSSKEPSLSPPAQLSPDSPALTNGHEDSVFVDGGIETSSQRVPKRDPSHKVSRPFLLEKKEPQTVNYNLQKMVLPVSKSWIKCGYLWLRMKLPNNRYAWTYIYCVVDKERGELMIQEQSLRNPRRLENLMLCNTRACNPDFIDRNYCFRVISPTSEHLFQTLNEQQMSSWVSALQETTEEALKRTDHRVSRPELMVSSNSIESVASMEIVPNAMKEILSVPGNKACADCSSTTDVEWASINLGIVICIKCSGVHRGLGVHVSKVRSLNLDKWDRPSVDFMLSQGNLKSNSYYEATMGEGLFVEDVKKPNHKSSKEERNLFIQQKYVSLAFVPECGDDRNTQL